MGQAQPGMMGMQRGDSFLLAVISRRRIFSARQPEGWIWV